MVEVYFNAQSNNGTLTDGELIQGVVGPGPGTLLFPLNEPHLLFGTVSPVKPIFKGHPHVSSMRQAEWSVASVKNGPDRTMEHQNLNFLWLG